MGVNRTLDDKNFLNFILKEHMKDKIIIADNFETLNSEYYRIFKSIPLKYDIAFNLQTSDKFWDELMKAEIEHALKGVSQIDGKEYNKKDYKRVKTAWHPKYGHITRN